MKCLMIFFVGIMISVGLSASLFAEENQTAAPWVNSNNYQSNNLVLAVDKLGRGVLNTAFGVVEIPKQSIKRAIDTNSSYGYISGLFLGIGYFVLRELSGVYEIVTFPLPLPGGYTPVIDPLLGYKPRIIPKIAE